jgi:hypothetical protein
MGTNTACGWIAGSSTPFPTSGPWRTRSHVVPPGSSNWSLSLRLISACVTPARRAWAACGLMLPTAHNPRCFGAPLPPPPRYPSHPGHRRQPVRSPVDLRPWACGHHCPQGGPGGHPPHTQAHYLVGQRQPSRPVPGPPKGLRPLPQPVPTCSAWTPYINALTDTWRSIIISLVPLMAWPINASRLWHLSDAALVSHFHSKYPQHTSWCMLTLPTTMLSAVIGSLLRQGRVPAGLSPAWSLPECLLASLGDLLCRLGPRPLPARRRWQVTSSPPLCPLLPPRYPLPAAAATLSALARWKMPNYFHVIKGARFAESCEPDWHFGYEVSQFQVIIEYCLSQGDSIFVQYIKWDWKQKFRNLLGHPETVLNDTAGFISGFVSWRSTDRRSVNYNA